MNVTPPIAGGVAAVTNPVLTSILAAATLLLLHVPPGVELPIVAVVPVHIAVGPVKMPGKGLTVTTVAV